MKKLVVLTAVTVGLTSMASANQFTDFDSIVHRLTDTTSGRSYMSTFSVVTEDPGADVYTNHGFNIFTGLGTSVLGYTPGDPITAASVSFGLWDNDSAKEQVSFYVGGFKVGDSGPSEQISGYRTYSFDLFSVFNPGTLTSVLGDLSDGTISYQVLMRNSWSSENVWLKWASLSVTSERASVPDGGATLVLLGLGLIGVACAQRRR